LGCDGFWMKPGLGEHGPPKESKEHLIDLIDVVAHCLTDHYVKFRRICRGATVVRETNTFWWANKQWVLTQKPTGAPRRFWQAVENTGPDPDKIFDRFDQALAMLRSYLRSDKIDPLTGDAKEEYRSAMMTTLGKIIEEVHCFRKFQDDTGQIPRSPLVGEGRWTIKDQTPGKHWSIVPRNAQRWRACWIEAANHGPSNRLLCLHGVLFGGGSWSGKAPRNALFTGL
jgi:hypothetical protein